MKNIVIAITLSICSIAANGQTHDSTTTKQSLPSVTLKNTDGENVDVSSYATNGKITIISFWATWCKPCIKELKNINDVLDEWIEEYNVELVAVSVDDSRNSARVKPFTDGQGWDFDILLDPNGALQRDMNVTNPPVTFLIDQNGKIVYTHTGYLEGDELDLEDEIIKLAAAATSEEEEEEVDAKNVVEAIEDGTDG
ncbi:MAG: cytochrome c biogenesis protein CcmG/thiol:disulfide interchange protein DsbE [Bacteroidia bacterium]|jgi:cytochrome c biogenesis protein CcmG/thiol:disulfide interchange protein DsbE